MPLRLKPYFKRTQRAPDTLFREYIRGIRPGKPRESEAVMCHHVSVERKSNSKPIRQGGVGFSPHIPLLHPHKLCIVRYIRKKDNWRIISKQ